MKLNFNLNISKIISEIVFLMIIFGPLLSLLGQENSGIFIDTTKSDPTQRRETIIAGNNVETMISNWGGVGQGQQPISGIWPKGTQHDHIHEFTGFVAAQVPDSTGNRTIIISDGYIDGGGTRGEVDRVTGIEYKFHPLPGYFNNEQGQDEFANSLNENSWPARWPDKENDMGDPGWPGQWNGFFGKNQFQADNEAMFYLDDAWNNEFRFYPYNDLKDSVIGRRKGLGIQILTRFFQWSHPLAKDILFYYFDITNASDFDYSLLDPQTLVGNPITFGGFGDIGPGGRGTSDDNAWYNTDVDMFYGWDNDNIGVWDVFSDIPPGYMGWKFLESPGLIDLLDNDNDGLVDERRDNEAGAWIFGPIGIYGDPNDHFEGDEDGDWLAAMDDVGTDGQGPLDDGYTLPDADGTEGNGIPDQGEPNFGKLDNDESDQIGLTAASAPLYGTIFISDEAAMWERIQPGYFVQPTQSVNQFWLFASGPIALHPKGTERFSTAFLFAFTEPSLFRVATISQRIFNSDYKFAKPPKQPNVRAIAGDGKVTLIWDERAELSRDPIYGYDFEGYKIWKSTDPQFLDGEFVTDSYGAKVYRAGIAQFDYDNGLSGPHSLQYGETLGAPSGSHYNMGDDTGLKHYFVDEDVINGRTYYYAVVSYDTGYDTTYFERGLSDLEGLLPITPSESPASIIVQGGLITRTDRNTVVVTPSTRAGNFSDASVSDEGEAEHTEGRASGGVQVSIIEPEIVDSKTYTLSFKTIPGKNLGEYETSHYSLYDETNSDSILIDQKIDTSLVDERYASTWTKELFDEGIVLSFDNQYPSEEWSLENSGWEEDVETNFRLSFSAYRDDSPRIPITFIIEFADTNDMIDSAFVNSAGRSSFPVNFTIYDAETGERINCVFREGLNVNGRVDPGEELYVVFKEDPTSFRWTGVWQVDFLPPSSDESESGVVDSIMIEPQEGDRLWFRSLVNFAEQDEFQFSTNESANNPYATSASLDAIKVVPNPYVSYSILEKQPYLSGRGERFIRFTHLPQKCKVSIFTVNGDLVQTLEHDSPIGDGDLRWNLRSKDNLEVSFGIYIYVVETPDIGEKIGKFAIIN